MTDTPSRFEVWVPACEAPPRSRLYSLEPIGIGTPEVESLSSYLNRLAQAHCVTVNALIAHELLPHVGTPAPPSVHPAPTPPRHLRQDKLYIRENEGILHVVKNFPCRLQEKCPCSCP